MDARTRGRERSAAFYDVDGTLIKTNIVHAFAWYAANQPTLTKSVTTWMSTLVSVPAFLVADQLSRKLFNEIFYRYYKGLSRDRLEVLSEELFDDVIRPSVYPRARDLVEESRRAGCRQVIVTGGLDFTVFPLARFLGIDEVVANRLEFVEGHATGRLQRPVIAGATKAAVMRDYGERQGIDLAGSWAYADSYSDYPMLAVVGHPTAVNPDFRLRNVARSYDWPVIHLG